MRNASQPTGLRLHRYVAFARGTRLLVLGAVHGDERCGTLAISRLVAELDAGSLAIARGTLTVVPVANPYAYACGCREGDRNLNRALFPRISPQDFEDHAANVLTTLFKEHDVLVDLHSFAARGDPFVLIGPPDNSGPLEPFGHARAEAELAAHLGPSRVVEGWLPAYAAGVRRRVPAGANGMGLEEALAFGIGTTEQMRACGGYAVTLECGSHDDPHAVAIAYQALRQSLALLGLVDEAPAPPRAPFQVLALHEVVDRNAPGDTFTRPGSSFDPVTAGEHVGTRADGTVVRAPEDGFVVFPNADAAPGTEWVYFARLSARRLLEPAT